MASIGLTAVAAFDAQRAVRAQSEVVERATREFSSFAAWSYSEHLKQQLALSAFEVVGAVNHGENLHTSPRVPEAHELVHYLPTDIRCDCHRTHAGPSPEIFFGFKLGTRNVDVARNLYSAPSEGWRVTPMADHNMELMQQSRWSKSDTWIADTLAHHARAGHGDDHGYGIVVARHNGSVVPITYTLMPTSWGDTMVYGVTYSAKALSGIFAGVLDGSGLLPATFTKGARNRDVVALRVSDGSNQTIYESEPGVNSPAFTRLSLPPEYGALMLHVMIRPDQASNLIIGGLPRSRLPFLLGLLALAAMMSVIAVLQIRRETELAGMRADFVSSISHELRTPLAQIKLYLETVRLGRASTPEQRDWSLAHIDRETTRLGNLVENVLRFSRLGRSDPSGAESVDLSAEVEKIADEFRPLAASRKATIEVAIHDRPLVRMRSEAIRHVLVNLLDNAVKYGPVSQTIRVATSLRNGDAIISVSDEGAGVPPAEREKIWPAFARVKTATDAAGSGIGLTIVRDVVQQHGGKVWVEDAEKRGARFVVSVPSAGRASSVATHEEQQAPVAVG